MRTFENRNTSLESRKAIFGVQFKIDTGKQIQWSAFLKRNRLMCDESFSSVVEKIENFIEPLFATDEIKEDTIW